MQSAHYLNMLQNKFNRQEKNKTVKNGIVFSLFVLHDNETGLHYTCIWIFLKFLFIFVFFIISHNCVEVIVFNKETQT